MRTTSDFLRTGRRWWTGPFAGLLALAPVVLMVQAGATPLAVTSPSPIVAASPSVASSPAPSVVPNSARPSPVVTVSPSVSPSGTATAAPRGPSRFTMAFTGDILVHQALWERAASMAEGSARFDFRPMFAPLRPVIASADLAICHLETPLSPDDRDLASYPTFEAPHEVAGAIAWAGYEGCSTASNHSLDGGSEGVRATLAWLDRARLGHAGTARAAAEAARIATYEVEGAAVAHLSYSWGFNGFTPDEPWRANRIAVSRVVADAHRARKAGADLVVVSLHWGVEYTHDPTAWQRDVAERLTRSGAIDLIVGHHAHVVQPVARIHGTWVAFGLGNVLSGMTASLGTEAVADGMVLMAEARRSRRDWTIGAVSFVPTRVEYGTWRVLPVARTLALHRPDPAMRTELRASWARTVGAVRLLGSSVSPAGRLPS